MKHKILSLGLFLINLIVLVFPIIINEVDKASAIAAFSQITDTLNKLLLAGNPEIGFIEWENFLPFIILNFR